MCDVADFKQPLDQELQTMLAMWKLLEKLDPTARGRVLQWLMQRGMDPGAHIHGRPMGGYP